MKQRTREEVDLIVKNLRGAAACKTKEEFDAWFDKTYPYENAQEQERAERKNDGDRA